MLFKISFVLCFLDIFFSNKQTINKLDPNLYNYRINKFIHNNNYKVMKYNNKNYVSNNNHCYKMSKFAVALC